MDGTKLTPFHDPTRDLTTTLPARPLCGLCGMARDCDARDPTDPVLEPGASRAQVPDAALGLPLR